MIDQTVAVAICTALVTLGAAVAFQRLWPESAIARASPPRSSPRRAGDATADADRRVRGPGSVVAQPQTRVWYGAQYQVDDFVAAMIASEGGCDKWRDRAIIHAYRAWARDGHIAPVPDSVLLELLARHPHVKRSRDRLKDAHGRVLKLPSGTPMRGSFYTISARPYAVVPKGVAAPRKAGVRAAVRKVESGPRVRKGPERVQTGKRQEARGSGQSGPRDGRVGVAAAGAGEKRIAA